MYLVLFHIIIYLEYYIDCIVSP